MLPAQDNLPIVKIPKLKRLFDIIFSLLMIIITFPLFVVIVLAVVIEHILRGKFFVLIFYKEQRISQGQPFNFYKFNIFKSEIIQDLKNRHIFIFTKSIEHTEGSLTVVGRIIQQIYLDELPQVFSILKGEMSTVGPRPVNLMVYQKNLEAGDRTKQVIKTGWTGPSQSVKGISSQSHYELNRRYIEYCAKSPGWKVVLLDIKYILKSLRIIARAEGI